MYPEEYSGRFEERGVGVYGDAKEELGAGENAPMYGEDMEKGEDPKRFATWCGLGLGEELGDRAGGLLGEDE